MVTCERWLCAPRSEIFFEHGHRLVTGTTTLTHMYGLAVADLADQRRLVVHQALDAGHRRALHHEIRETSSRCGRRRRPGASVISASIERNESTEISRSSVQDLDEARHVRALEVVRQVHVHVEGRDGVLLAGRAVLDPDRMADVLDADAVDRNAARVGAAPARPRPTRRWRPGALLTMLMVRSPAVSVGSTPPAALNLVAARASFKPGTSARQRSMRRGDAGRIQAGLQQAVIAAAVLDEAIGNADVQPRRSSGPRHPAPRRRRCRRRRRRRSPRG